MPHEPSEQPTRALAGLNPSALVRLGMAEKTDAPPQVPGYAILEALGRGGMGEVFRACQESLGRDVALKILRPGLTAAGWLPERFEQEARIMAALQHPNVVTVHDCVRLDDGRVAIVMELVGGGSLRQRIAAAPDGLPLPQALSWAREIAEGLRAAHGAGLVHRDVKPDNVLIDEAGIARVSDFGLAFSGGVKQTRYTQTGAAAGTPGYMPPEIWRGASADARSDVFSYGAMLYEMLTGRLPQGSFPPPRTLRPDISPALNDAIVAALRPDPAQRPPDMAAMLRAVNARPALWTRRRAAAALTTAAAVAAGGAWWGLTREKPGVRPNPQDAPPDGPWTLIPWPPRPEALQIRGAWILRDQALLSDDSVCILPIPGIEPRPCRLRLRFRRLTGLSSIGLFFRTARGTAVATLDGRLKHLGGVQSVAGHDLESPFVSKFKLALENGRDYEWIVEIHPSRIRMWVDGVLKDDHNIAGKTLTIPETWEWSPRGNIAAVHLGSWESSTLFHSLEWQTLE